MNTIRTTIFILTISLFCSCNQDDANLVSTNQSDYAPGYLILHEGFFGQNDASISFLSQDFGELSDDVFYLLNNNQSVGDVLQSGVIHGNFMYLMVNNSQKIVIVNRFSMQKVGEISDLTNVRYMAIRNSTKAYVSSWGSGFDGSTNQIFEIDLNAQTISQTFDIPSNGVVERIYFYGDKLFALVNGFGNGNTILVINPDNGNILNTLNVGNGPESAAFIDGEMYVLCGGATDFSFNPTADASIWKVNDAMATKILDWAEETPSEIEVADDMFAVGNRLYFQLRDEGGDDIGIYTYHLNTENLEKLIALDASYYCFNVVNDYMFGLNSSSEGIVYGLDGNQVNTFSTSGNFPAEVIYNP